MTGTGKHDWPAAGQAPRVAATAAWGRWFGRPGPLWLFGETGDLSPASKLSAEREAGLMNLGQLARQAPCWFLAAALCACAPGGSGPTLAGAAAASCIGPALTTAPHARPGQLTARTVTVSAGQRLWVYGSGYQTCHDTNMQPPARPYRHLMIFVVQGGTRTLLATVSARPPDGTFQVAVRLPATLRRGAATVRTSLPMPELPVRLNVR
jgi:hypothetical protein